MGRLAVVYVDHALDPPVIQQNYKLLIWRVICVLAGV